MTKANVLSTGRLRSHVPRPLTGHRLRLAEAPTMRVGGRSPRLGGAPGPRGRRVCDLLPRLLRRGLTRSEHRCAPALNPRASRPRLAGMRLAVAAQDGRNGHAPSDWGAAEDATLRPRTPPRESLRPRGEKPDYRYESPRRTGVGAGHERRRIERLDAPVVRFVSSPRPEWKAVDHDLLVDEDTLVDRDVEVASIFASEASQRRSGRCRRRGDASRCSGCCFRGQQPPERQSADSPRSDQTDAHSPQSWLFPPSPLQERRPTRMISPPQPTRTSMDRDHPSRAGAMQATLGWTATTLRLCRGARGASSHPRTVTPPAQMPVWQRSPPRQRVPRPSTILTEHAWRVREGLT